MLLLVFSTACNDCICPENYDPVCGENGRTYGNPCLAECDDVQYIEGECPVYGIGKIEYSGDTICGYYILVLGTRYKPTNLPDDHKIHGQNVGMRYRKMNKWFTCDDPYSHDQEIILLQIEKL